MMRFQVKSLIKLQLRSVLLSGLLALSFVTSNASARGDARFPQGPDQQLTPGSTCQSASTYRYPEHIPYCNRDVDSSEKKSIIAMYDIERGYSVRQMDRQQFKIDHYIPLCMGGSNERDNLWPQHKSVYMLTDPMEGLACEKMAEGVLKQADAIRLIKEGKNDFDKIDGIVEYLNSL